MRQQPNKSVKWTPNPLRGLGSLRPTGSGATYLKRYVSEI